MTIADVSISAPITAPAIFGGMSYATYAAIKAVNKSLLCKLSITPADAKAYMDGGGEMTEALAFGIGAHCLMLEPEKFGDEFAIEPPDADGKFSKWNTNVGKERWRQFADANVGKTLIRGDDGAAMMGMRAALFSHPLAAKLLRAPGRNELTVVWQDPLTGLLCKLRNDRLIDWEGGKAVVEYKTAANASESRFPIAYGQFRYFIGDAFYRDGNSAALGESVRMLFIAQEKKPPYKVNVFEFPDYVQFGRDRYRQLLDDYAVCHSRNIWPAVGPGYCHELIPGYVPDFAMRDAFLPEAPYGETL